MINAASENFVVHRRFVLTIVMKIDDRKKDENFIAAAIDETSETNKTNEKEINKIIVMNETTKKRKVNKKQY